MERRWFGRACSLAVLGQEEGGKALYFFLVAIGAMRLKPDAIRVLFRRHVPKQQLGHASVAVEKVFDTAAMAAALVAAMKPLIDAEPAALDAATPGEVAATLRQSLDHFAEALDSNPAGVAAIVEGVRETMAKVQGLNLDPLKQSGLYVDFDEDVGTISTPQDLNVTLAQPQLDILRQSVRILAPMFDLVPASAVEPLRETLEPLVAEASAKARGSRAAQPEPKDLGPSSG